MAGFKVSFAKTTIDHHGLPIKNWTESETVEADSENDAVALAEKSHPCGPLTECEVSVVQVS